MEFTGATTTELLSNEQWLRFVHPDDLLTVEVLTQRTLETGVTEDSEIRLRRHDGEYRWHICRQFASRNSVGEIERWYGTCTDIELQKRDEAALRDSEQRFVGFMQHFPGFAWIKNLDGRYVFANNKFDQLVEGRHDSIRGLTDDEIFAPEQAEAFRQGDQQAIKNSSGIHEFQTVKISIDNDAQFFVSKFPILGPQGNPLLVGGMAIASGPKIAQDAERIAIDAPIPTMKQFRISYCRGRNSAYWQNTTTRPLAMMATPSAMPKGRPASVLRK
jgi:PAS domain S-box-containing protein